MASWLQRGRPALFEALQQVCERIDSDLATELQERDVVQHTFLTKEVERLRSRVDNVDRLEQENGALKDEVTALRAQMKSASFASDKPTVSAGTPVPRRQPLGEISTNTPSRAVDLKAHPKEPNADGGAAAKFAELQLEYAKLASTCETLRRGKVAAEAAARKLQDERDRWMKYAESREAKIEKLKKRDLGSGRGPRSSTEPRQPLPGLEVTRAETTPAEAVSVSTTKATLGSSVPPPASASISFSGFANPGSRGSSPRRATSSPPDATRPPIVDEAAQSTQGDEDEMPGETLELPQLRPTDNNNNNTDVIIKNEPSSDPPVLVSERRVGKRKHTDDLPSGPTSRAPRRFKTEEWSSDPLVMGEAHHFSPQESLDLDQDGSMPTPRKIRMLQMQGRSEVINPDTDNVHGRSSVFDDRSAGPRTTPGHVVQAPRTAIKDMHVYAPPSRQTTPGSWKPRRTDPDSGLKLKHGIASLAEDGYDPNRSGRHAPEEEASNDGPSRLDTLLNASSPAPQGQPPLLRPTRQPKEAAHSSPWLTETPVRILPFGKDAGKDANSRTKMLQSKMAGDGDSAPASPRPVSRLQTPKTGTPAVSKPKSTVKRLRDQPVASLRMEDFRIKPKHNNGYAFAFTEVVRNKDERADLPGCVDPQCCGKYFKALARSELESAGPSAIHRPADIALLEDYLGNQVYKLGSMTRQEKEELWLEAKTRELANKHGKHRHRFTRRQSPPGFWNTDFPTTQENQRDKAEGEKRERRMVEERYREAMRDGGRWLFRDELDSVR